MHHKYDRTILKTLKKLWETIEEDLTTAQVDSLLVLITTCKNPPYLIVENIYPVRNNGQITTIHMHCVGKVLYPLGGLDDTCGIIQLKTTEHGFELTLDPQTITKHLFNNKLQNLLREIKPHDKLLTHEHLEGICALTGGYHLNGWSIQAHLTDNPTTSLEYITLTHSLSAHHTTQWFLEFVGQLTSQYGDALLYQFPNMPNRKPIEPSACGESISMHVNASTLLQCAQSKEKYIALLRQYGTIDNKQERMQMMGEVTMPFLENITSANCRQGDLALLIGLTQLNIDTYPGEKELEIWIRASKMLLEIQKANVDIDLDTIGQKMVALLMLLTSQGPRSQVEQHFWNAYARQIDRIASAWQKKKEKTSIWDTLLIQSAFVGGFPEDLLKELLNLGGNPNIMVNNVPILLHYLHRGEKHGEAQAQVKILCNKADISLLLSSTKINAPQFLSLLRLFQYTHPYEEKPDFLSYLWNVYQRKFWDAFKYILNQPCSNAAYKQEIVSRIVSNFLTHCDGEEPVGVIEALKNACSMYTLYRQSMVCYLSFITNEWGTWESRIKALVVNNSNYPVSSLNHYLALLVARRMPATMQAVQTLVVLGADIKTLQDAPAKAWVIVRLATLLVVEYKNLNSQPLFNRHWITSSNSFKTLMQTLQNNRPYLHSSKDEECTNATEIIQTAIHTFLMKTESENMCHFIQLLGNHGLLPKITASTEENTLLAAENLVKHYDDLKEKAPFLFPSPITSSKAFNALIVMLRKITCMPCIHIDEVNIKKEIIKTRVTCFLNTTEQENMTYFITLLKELLDKDHLAIIENNWVKSAEFTL